MWFYHKEAEEIETLTCLETGAQVMRSSNELWWRGNVIDRPLDQDEMKIATCKDSAEAQTKFTRICFALGTRGELVGHPRAESEQN